MKNFETVTILVQKEYKDEFKELCKRIGVTPSSLLRTVIAHFVEEERRLQNENP